MTGVYDWFVQLHQQSPHLLKALLAGTLVSGVCGGWQVMNDTKIPHGCNLKKQSGDVYAAPAADSETQFLKIDNPQRMPELVSKTFALAKSASK